MPQHSVTDRKALDQGALNALRCHGQRGLVHRPQRLPVPFEVCPALFEQVAGPGRHDVVAPLVGQHRDHRTREGLEQPLSDLAGLVGVGLHIGHQQPFGRQRLAAVVVEAARAQRLGNAIAGEAVHQDEVISTGRLGHELRAVVAHGAQALVIGRDVEGVAQVDHALADLDHRQVRLGHVAVQVLEHRSATQPDHQHAARLRIEEQGTHHRAGVVQHQVVRVRHAHAALDQGALEAEGHGLAVGVQPGLVGHGGQVFKQPAIVGAAYRYAMWRIPPSGPARHTEPI